MVLQERKEKKMKTECIETNVFLSYWNCIKKYCHFNGRISRRNYWSFVLVNFIIGFILGYIEGIKGEPPVWSGAYSIFVALPALAAQYRRLHDVNRSGWWLGGLLIFLFVYGVTEGIMEYNGHIINDIISNVVTILILIWVIVLLIFYIKKGNPEDNKYGNPQA